MNLLYVFLVYRFYPVRTIPIPSEQNLKNGPLSKLLLGKLRKFYNQKVLKLYKENWKILQSKSVETLQRKLRKFYNQKVLKLYKEIEKNLQSKSVETLQWNWEKIPIKSVETFKILNQILRPKVFDLISCLIRLTNQKSKSVLTWQFLFELYLNLTQKG